MGLFVCFLITGLHHSLGYHQDRRWGGGNWKTEGELGLKLRVELGVGGRSGVEGVRGVEGVVGSKST